MGVSLWKQNNVFMSISLLVLYLVTFVFGQDLAFTSPNLTSSGSELPHYSVGDYVGVSWTTPFEETNLLVYQLKEKAYAYEVLALNYQQNVTFFVWYAQAVDGQPLNKDHPFHFVLENGKSYSCQGCVTQSSQFNVRKAQAQAGSTTSSSSTSSATAAAAKSTHHQTTKGKPSQASQTHGQSPTASAAGSAGQQQQATPSVSHSQSNQNLKVGLGVGLGLGIPLLLAIGAFFFLLARRRRRQRKRISYHPTGSGNWTAENEVKRESGALGPLGERSQSRASGLSQMSHSSWIEPWDFEKPELRDQDAISQLRQSIHSGSSNHAPVVPESGTDTPSTAVDSRPPSWPLRSNGENGANTKYAWMGGAEAPTKASTGFGAGVATARRSDTNYANLDLSSLEGMPERLQPVHHRYGSPTSATGFSTPSHGDGRDWPLP